MDYQQITFRKFCIHCICVAFLTTLLYFFLCQLKVYKALKFAQQKLSCPFFQPTIQKVKLCPWHYITNFFDVLLKLLSSPANGSIMLRSASTHKKPRIKGIASFNSISLSPPQSIMTNRGSQTHIIILATFPPDRAFEISH